MHCQTSLLFGSHPCSNKGPFHTLQSFGVNLEHGLSIGCNVDICSDELSPWAAKQYLLHPGLFQNSIGCMGISAWALPPPSHLWPLCSQGCFLHFGFLKYVYTEVLPVSLMGVAMFCGGSAAELLCPAILPPTPNTRPEELQSVP